MSHPKYTVFTPAYNRAHTIERVYLSLKAQTCRDFEWIVVDDGSSDNTAEMIRGWQQEAGFPILYSFQENSGKHMAINRGVQLAQGELFLIIDSDDGFLPESLEKMLYWWECIPENERTGFTGIVTLCQYEDGRLCGELFPESPLDTNALELAHKYKIRAETWGFHRTDVMKEFPFPEDPKVRFVPENIVWGAIARKYKIRCINEPLRIFYQDGNNRLTKAQPEKKASVRKYFLQLINRDFDYFWQDPGIFIKWTLLYVRYSLHMKDGACLHWRNFSGAGPLLLCWLAFLPGLGIYALDMLLYKGGGK